MTTMRRNYSEIAHMAAGNDVIEVAEFIRALPIRYDDGSEFD
jgi:hypothetical protein